MLLKLICRHSNWHTHTHTHCCFHSPTFPISPWWRYQKGGFGCVSAVLLELHCPGSTDWPVTCNTDWSVYTHSVRQLAPDIQKIYKEVRVRKRRERMPLYALWAICFAHTINSTHTCNHTEIHSERWWLLLPLSLWRFGMTFFVCPPVCCCCWGCWVEPARGHGGSTEAPMMDGPCLFMEETLCCVVRLVCCVSSMYENVRLWNT